MANGNLSARTGLAWGRLARITRLALGGVIVGSFVGVYLGALLGLVYAAWAGDLSPALDGALLGGGVAALLGIVYGAILGVTERTDPAHAGSPLPSPPSPLSDLPAPRAAPAGRPGSTTTPEMEHTHGR
jgi:hypothetical protein